MDFSFASSCVGVAVRTSIASSNVQVRPFLTSNIRSAQHQVRFSQGMLVLEA